MRDDLPSGTVTFLFSDVEGSTRLLHSLGAEAYADALAEHRRVIREACGAEGGVEVDTQGDAFFFAFPTAPGALTAAAFSPSRWPSARSTCASACTRDSRSSPTRGTSATTCTSRHESRARAHGGQVVLSGATRALVDGVALTDLGEHRLKDIEGAVSIFQLGAKTFPPLKTISNTNLPRPASSFVGREHEISAGAREDRERGAASDPHRAGRLGKDPARDRGRDDARALVQGRGLLGRARFAPRAHRSSSRRSLRRSARRTTSPSTSASGSCFSCSTTWSR